MEALVSTTDPDRPYGYTVSAQVFAQVSARNSYGFGTPSARNPGAARVRYVPAAPSAPTVGSIATDTQVLIQWTALTFGTSTGLVPITAYSLYSDNGSGDGVYNEIATGLMTSYLVTGLTGGT